MTRYEQESVHDAVGAYVLGVLDEADASAFEAHLAGCDICAARLEEFSGMEPMLAMLAEAPAPPPQNVHSLPGMPGRMDFPPPRPAPVVPTSPSPRVLDGLLNEVAAGRAAKRRRGMYLLAAAAALIDLEGHADAPVPMRAGSAPEHIGRVRSPCRHWITALSANSRMPRSATPSKIGLLNGS